MNLRPLFLIPLVAFTSRFLFSACLLTLTLLVALGFPQAEAATRDTLSLAGSWRFQLDRDDAGTPQRWFAKTLPGKLKLPGSLPGQGLGDPVTVETRWIGGIVDKSFFTSPEYEKYRQPGNVKVPFWLQPETYYAGVAWYQRHIEIPPGWADQRVVLFLERPHWETRVWVDDRLIGTNDSLSVPHQYDLGTGLAPGQHTLTLRVDNRMVIDIGENSHSVSDHTQGNWNGIVGRMELRATPPVWIEDLQVFPQFTTKSVKVKGTLGNATARSGQGQLRLSAERIASRSRREETADLPEPQLVTRTLEVHWTAAGGNWETEIHLGNNAPLWNEFAPNLYALTATLELPMDGRRLMSAATTLLGLREISTQGTQFLVNGQPTFIRGTLDCCIYPKTGHPPTDVASWKKIIGAGKAHGLNNFRFHSWCPPDAAFIAADELGFYLHVECSSWANMSTTLGDGKPVDEWLYREADRILKAYGNHPSFVILLSGNEPGGRNHVAYLKQWVDHCKAQDPRRLYSSGAGWPQIPENQFHVTPDPRVQAWGGGLKSRINAKPPETVTDYRDYIAARTVPVISHEIGQWCVYPNFAEMKKYTGYLKPRNFEVFRDTLHAHGMLDQAKPFLLASGKLQALCYKEDIESALRTPGMGGFQLLDLHDFPGQGTALVGVLDPFWEEKGYVTPKEYRRFCNSTVPLARLKQRVFTTDDTLEADIEVAHYGPAPMQNALTTWRLVGDDGTLTAVGKFPAGNIPTGTPFAVGRVSAELKNVPAPARYKLVVRVGSSPDKAPNGRATATGFENDWDVWVYPAALTPAAPGEVKLSHDLDAAALDALQHGENVLLLLPPERVKADPQRGNIALGFSSIFWNTAWTGGQAPHTLGVLCDPKHPLFAKFPTDFHSNWQWWYLVNRAGAMILDGLPATLRPTVQVIDDWFSARKLGLLFEARLGAGKLVVCSIDLERDQDTNLVARQFRHSLLQYMAGKQFKPKIEVTADQVRGLFREPSAMQKHSARILKASSAEDGFAAENAIDGNPNTLWHTRWTGNLPSFPHELAIEFKPPIAIRGFTVLPRQDNNRNGWIKEYACYVSNDGQNWGEPVAQGTFPSDAQLKTVTLATPTSARFVRFVASSGHTSGSWASLAEFGVVAE